MAMKRLLLASTALALGGPALAADLPARMPLKAPIAAVSRYSWTGCYVGGHIGAGWGRAHLAEPNGFIAPAGTVLDVVEDAGFLGGGQVGCDYEFANNWVIGAAGDFSWANIQGQSIDPFFMGKSPVFLNSPIPLNAKTEWLATATARVGYAWDRWLVYGKGGLAWAHDRYSIQNAVAWGTPGSLCFANFIAIACNPSGSDTRNGWTLGLGVEWAFANNWSAGLEFDHYGFGTRTVSLTDPNVPTGSPSEPVNIKQRIEAVTLSLNYHFGWPGRP
jgi:outer membrane immunogenic protein